MLIWKNSNFKEKMALGHGWSETVSDSNGKILFRWFWNNSTSESVLENIASGERFVLNEGSSSAKRLVESLMKKQISFSGLCQLCENFTRSI